MNARRMWAVLTVVAIAIAIVGCGADRPEVSDIARDELEPRVAEVRRLADAGQPEQALVELDALRVLVADLSATGALSDERAADLRTALDAVTMNLELITTTTTAPAGEDDEDKDEDEDKDDRGKGNDRDDER